MKKRFFIVAMLLALFTITAYAIQENPTNPTEEKPRYPECGTPIDKNCNGIPDYQE